MGFFDGASKVKAGEDGNKLAPGAYPALEVIQDKVKDGHHGLRRIIVFRVLAEGQATEPGKAPTPVGGEGSISIRLDGQYRTSALAESNAITGAMLGYDLDQTNARLLEVERESERAVDQTARPFCGRVITATAYSKVTGKGHTMIKIRCQPWDRVRMGTGEPPTQTDEDEGTPATSAAPPPPPPAPAAPPPPPAAFPPPGWWPDPHGRGFYNAAGVIKSEADLRSGA